MQRIGALCVLLGFAALAGCGGGANGSSALPTTGSSNGSTATPQKMVQGHVTAVVPQQTKPQSGKRKPAYINSSDPNSALVISVTPADPAEASQWQSTYGTQGFTVCYNLYTNGTVNAALNPVPVAGGVQVSFALPAPPGNDSFTFYQYDGQCSPTNPYTAPTPSPAANGNGVLAVAPALTVNLSSGAANNFNVALTACGAASTTGGPCSNATPAPGTPPTTVQLGAAVSTVYLALASPAPKALANTIPLPISAPIREQHAFLTAGNKIGIPIPVVGLDSSGFVIAGSPGTGAGFLPKAGDNVTISHTETGPGGTVSGHALLYLVDATTGAIAQTEVAGTTPIKLTQLNALDAADATGGGTVGDPYVVVLTFDGSAATQVTSLTVNLNATINGSAITPQSVTIKPQSTMYSAGAAPNGYADAAGPYASAADILNLTGTSLAAPNNGYWVTDGGNIRLVGVGSFAVTGATVLTGETLDNNANIAAPQILAVNNGATSGAASTSPQASGVYVFDPVAHTSKPLAIQDLTTGNYVKIGSPQAIAFVSGGFVYVDAGNTIYAIDPQGGGAGGGFATDTTGNFFLAEEIGTLPVSGLNSGSDKGFDMIASGTKLLFADTGNNRIAQIDTASCVPGGASCTVTAFASGHAFVGFAANGTSYLATDSSGQIYTITSTGTVTSLGLSTGAVGDGPIGVLGSTTLTPQPYAVQGNSANFFSTAPTPTLPYTLAPFAAAGPVFAPAAQAAILGAPLGLANNTESTTMNATATGKTKATFGIARVPAANATNAALTPDSYLFTDSGNVRTLIP